MSYCLGIKTRSGLVLASDSRTHGSVDQVNIYSKMHRFEVDRERIFVLLSSGNLSITQTVVHRLQRELGYASTRRGLFRVETLFDAAEYVGHLSREIQNYHGKQNEGMSFDASFILGGQIGEQPPELLLVYPEGNCIYVQEDKPFLQIGDTAYGKPILDRYVTPDISLEDAARCGVLSVDSTMRSNLAVGPPVELAIYRNDEFTLSHYARYEADSPFFLAMQESWAATVRKGIHALPRFEWEGQDSTR